MYKQTLINYYLGLCQAEDVQKTITPEVREEALLWAKDQLLLPALYQIVGDNTPADLVAFDEPAGQTPKAVFDRYLVRRRLIEEELHWIDEVAKARQIPVLLLKGFVTERYYRNKQQRYTGDVDLVIPQVEHLWPFLIHAFGSGYEHFVLPALKSQDGTADAVIGIVKAEREHIASKQATIGTEFNIGGFTITDQTMIAWDDLYKDAIDVEFEGGLCFKTPSIVMQVVVQVAENVTSESMRLRNALDLLILLSQTQPDEWNEIEWLLDKYELTHEFTRMMNTIQSNVPDVTALGVPHIVPLVARYGALDFWEEEHVRIYRGHILPLMKRNNWTAESISNVLHNARRERFFTKMEEDEDRYTERLIRLSQRFESPRAQFEAGHHVYVMHVADSIGGDFEWMERDGLHFMRTPAGMYFATAEGLESEEELDRVSAICKREGWKTC